MLANTENSSIKKKKKKEKRKTIQSFRPKGAHNVHPKVLSV